MQTLFCWFNWTVTTWKWVVEFFYTFVELMNSCEFYAKFNGIFFEMFGMECKKYSSKNLKKTIKREVVSDVEKLNPEELFFILLDSAAISLVFLEIKSNSHPGYAIHLKG